MPFRVALSGLNAAQTDLAVTGNNIANANTTGFKESRAEFVDVYAVAYQGISDTTPGSGVRTATVAQSFSQGNVNYTDNNLDLSINGQGFFIVEDVNGRYYTRAGEFHVDKDGYVVNNQNRQLMVFENETSSQIVPLQLTNQVGVPSATTSVGASLNLDADDVPFTDTAAVLAGANNEFTDGVGLIPAFDPTDPNTYHSSTSVTIYDSLGSAHSMTTYFRKINDDTDTYPHTWQIFTTVDGIQVDPLGGAAGEPHVAQFDVNGALLDVRDTGGSTFPQAQFAPFTLANGAAPLSLDLALTGTTQYGIPFSVNDLSQDGYTTGRLSNIDIEDNGTVYARFTNGEASVVGQIALANVGNPLGLRQMGGTAWAESAASGPATENRPLNGNVGSITSGALEASNVDVAEQLVNLIEAQRNFQANAQVITVADTVTQTIINIR